MASCSMNLQRDKMIGNSSPCIGVWLRFLRRIIWACARLWSHDRNKTKSKHDPSFWSNNTDSKALENDLLTNPLRVVRNCPSFTEQFFFNYDVKITRTNYIGNNCLSKYSMTPLRYLTRTASPSFSTYHVSCPVQVFLRRWGTSHRKRSRTRW